MIKFCPIMSFRHEDDDGIYCRMDECALWNEEKGQCCIKTMALAATVKSFGSVAVTDTKKGYTISPSSFCQNDLEYSFEVGM